jgi:hypothetical protein
LTQMMIVCRSRNYVKKWRKVCAIDVCTNQVLPRRLHDAVHWMKKRRISLPRRILLPRVCLYLLCFLVTLSGRRRKNGIGCARRWLVQAPAALRLISHGGVYSFRLCPSGSVTVCCSSQPFFSTGAVSFLATGAHCSICSNVPRNIAEM